MPIASCHTTVASETSLALTSLHLSIWEQNTAGSPLAYLLTVSPNLPFPSPMYFQKPALQIPHKFYLLFSFFFWLSNPAHLSIISVFLQVASPYLHSPYTFFLHQSSVRGSLLNYAGILFLPAWWTSYLVSTWIILCFEDVNLENQPGVHGLFFSSGQTHMTSQQAQF